MMFSIPGTLLGILFALSSTEVVATLASGSGDTHHVAHLHFRIVEVPRMRAQGYTFFMYTYLPTSPHKEVDDDTLSRRSVLS